MARIDYYDDPNAPKANSIVPAASAIVVNEEGKILLHRRSDNALWALPGGGLEIGESIAETIIREVKEETGFDIVPEYVTGIYSNPKHVIAFPMERYGSNFLFVSPVKLLQGNYV